MANMLTFKCDICGEVYHMAEDDIVTMKIERWVTDDEAPDGKAVEYADICPKCKNTINRVIANPGIIKYYEQEQLDYERRIYKLSSCMRKVYDKLNPDKPYAFLSFHEGECEKYADQFIEEHRTVQSSNKRLRYVIEGLIGFIVPVIVFMLIGQFS